MAATLPDEPLRVLIMGQSFQFIFRARVPLLLFTIALAVGPSLEQPRSAQVGSQSAAAGPKPAGIEIVEHNYYPELHVDGAPFFIDSAAFSYYRMPRDQWEAMLDRYSQLGINTIDLYIPWNWHEPKEGEFDFDGHTNPRRDLRALLALIAQKHLRLIARPGPEILNEWRNGGYPDWLLERAEYKMSREDVLEGRYPPLDNVNPGDAEAAAQGWLANSTHMAATRAWFAAVGKELAPFSSHHLISSSASDAGAPPRESSGPLLFVQIGDDLAEGRENRVGPDFWRYCEELRGMIDDSGVDAPVFINPTDARVPAAGSRLDPPIGVLGQWYMPRRARTGVEGRRIDAGDESEIELYAEELATQPDFPPAVIEFQAGWYAPGDDDRPLASAPANTLLSSRLLIANGIRGINYFPLQDTYTPAGYSVPWANRSYRWDAALDPNGDQQPRLRAVQRNSQVLHLWGAQLAASHKRVDFGVVDSLGSYPQGQLSREDVSRVTDSLLRFERLAAMAMLSAGIRDPEDQPVEQLLNDPVLFLPVFMLDKPELPLSERAQNEIVEYVRRGGTLVIFPERPSGKILDQLWQTQIPQEEINEKSPIHAQWKFGDGMILESTKDPLSWIELNRSFSGNRSQPESDWALDTLRHILSATRTRPAILLSGNPKHMENVVASEIVTNEGTGILGERQPSEGFLSVTNLSESDVGEADFEVLSPSASARKMDGVYDHLHLVIPPQESLLLPVEESLCLQPAANLPCSDTVQVAGAELVDAKRDGRVLELTFHVPATANVTLHLAQHPSHITLESTTVPEANWLPAHSNLEVSIPRGAAPDFLRVLRLVLPYFPQVPEIEKPSKTATGPYETSIWNSLSLPVGANRNLKSYPPLIEIAPNDPPIVLVAGANSDMKSTRSVNVSITGPLHGSGNLEIPAEQSSVAKIELKPAGADAMALAPDADGLLHGMVKLRSGRDQRSFPIDFLQMPSGATRHYQFDFDRDGAPEWVLENADLRLIVSPPGGGQVIALIEKSSGANLATSVGLIRDAFSYTENPPGGNPARARGLYGLFNRTYTAEWTQDSKDPGVKLNYEAPDIFPAGARIQKVIQFDEAKALKVSYRVYLNAAQGATADAGDATAATGQHQQSFVAINSFPALAGVEGATRFCWQPPNASDGATKDAVVSVGTPSPKAVPADTSADHCEDFVPGGNAIEVPDGIRSVQVRNPGRTGIELSWDCAAECARLRIDPKNYSSLFRLQFPALRPGEEQQYQVRIRAMDNP